jgi:hypothetical protein
LPCRFVFRVVLEREVLSGRIFGLGGSAAALCGLDARNLLAIFTTTTVVCYGQ